MDTIKLIKEHFPEISHKDRKKFKIVFEYESKATNKTVIECVKNKRKEFLDKKSSESPLLLKKILCTGLLIEVNDSLQDTTLHNYYSDITSKVGRKFMNAQYNLYNKEFNDILTTNSIEGNNVIKDIEKALEILVKSVNQDNFKSYEVIKMMQEDEVFLKRVVGLSKSYKKGK